MQSLQTDLETFSEHTNREPMFSIRTEYHPKRHGFGVYVETIAAIPVHLGLLLGDVANIFRAVWIISPGRS